MKKLFTTAIILLAFTGYAQTLNIEIKNSKPGDELVVSSATKGAEFRDSITIKKQGEKLSVKKDFQVPFVANIIYRQNTEEGPEQHRLSVGLLLNKQDAVTFTADDFSKIDCGKAFGGLYKDTDEYFDYVCRLEEKRNQNIKANEEKRTEEELERLSDEFDEIYAEFKESKIIYAKANPESLLSAYLLNGIVVSSDFVEKMDEAYNALSHEVKNSANGVYTGKKITAFKTIKVGEPAPDFEFTDIDGKKMKLSDYRGKYIMLDFWGSWCYWCRVGNPHLVEMYDKWGGKDFEIIGLAVGDTEAKWKQAIEKDGLKWVHANTGTDGNETLDLPTVYNINAYPSKLLIDGKGNIAVIEVGYYKENGPIEAALREEFTDLYVK